jgi:hypothetical protein
MPGLFGAIGCDPHLRESLQRRFSAPWEDCETVRLPNGIIGGHSFHPSRALHALEDGTHFALDGEKSIYKVETRPFKFSPTLELSTTCKGNVAIATNNLWYLATDWSGSFPLYYAHTPSGILFCSRLRPLAQILCPRLDIVGLRQFLHETYMLSGRTFYNGISRLMPGQVLTYDPFYNRSSIAETSKAWVGLELSSPSEMWTGLMEAVSRSLDKNSRNAVMMSGGWDSRTLLAAAKNYLGADQLLAYYHGGNDSLEGKIAKEVCLSLGVKFHFEPLSMALFDLDRLRRGFNRTETVVFQEWHRAGLLLSTFGIDCVSSGVFGEIMGGHYSRTMLDNGPRKLLTFLMQALGRNSSMSNIFDAFRIQELVTPWSVNPEVWGNIEELENAMNGDIESSLKRFVDRGVQTSDQLVEAFITEHRGSQYINSQMLSCRAYLDVSIPFADREFFAQASRIPITAKLHNALNRRVLHQSSPAILRFPTAAAPVPASMPILVQELSRLLRHIFEKRVKLSPVGWWDWEFLRNDSILNAIVDDLELDLWNKKAIRQRVAGLQRNRRESIGLLLQRILILYTVDLMLRNESDLKSGGDRISANTCL